MPMAIPPCADQDARCWWTYRTGTVGTVSMDMLAVDLTPVSQAGIGTPVELWGKGKGR